MENEEKWLYNYEFPITGSRACKIYTLKLIEIEKFFFGYKSLVHHSERIRNKLISMKSFLEKGNNIVPDQFESIEMIQEVNYFKDQFLFELLLSKHIDTYLSYLSTLLHQIYLSKPETLKTNEKVDVVSVLNFSSIDEFIQDYAEKKVESVSYNSFVDLKKYFNDRLGLNLIATEFEILVIEAIETRNIGVHNWGMVNKKYIRKTNCDPKMIGHIKVISKEWLESLVPALVNSVRQIDIESIKKFGIETLDFGGEIRENLKTV